MAYLTHDVGLVYSPLSKEVAEMSPIAAKYDEVAHESSKSAFWDSPREHEFRAILYPNNQLVYRYNVDHDNDLDTWYLYILKPVELIKLIKRYHVVGNKGVISIFFQLAVVVYIWIKAVFHPIYTKRDPQAAEYYVSHYFPSLLESYPNQYELYGLISAQSSYALILRLYVIVRLVKRSVMNRNGYREIEMSQMNGVFVESFVWPLKDWIRVCFSGCKHYLFCTRHPLRRSCNRCIIAARNACRDQSHLEETREDHLHSRCWDWNSLPETSGPEFLCCINPIDFARCYRRYGLEMDNRRRAVLHYPKDNCRIDISELSWLVILTFAAMPIVLFNTVIVAFMNILIESAMLGPMGGESATIGYLRRIPKLFMDAGRVLRLIDSYLFYLVPILHVAEQAVVHLDIGALLSRIRKLNDRLEADLEVLICNSLAERGRTHRPNKNRIGSARRKALNQSIEISMFLAKTISDEFASLKRSTTTFLNLLLLGGGICLASTGSLILVTESRLVRMVVITSTMAYICSMALTAIFCMAVEIGVSELEMRR